MELIDVSTNGGWAGLACLGLPVAAFTAFAMVELVAPERMWRLRHSVISWRYRDGHRLQPSRAGLVGERLIGVAMLAGTIVFAMLVSSEAINWSAESRVQRDLSGAETVYDLTGAAETPGCSLRIVVCLRSDEVFPIGVTSYEGSGTELRLWVSDQFFPTHAVVTEGRWTTVSLFGRCNPGLGDEPYGSSAADCADRRTGFFRYGVVPVTLDEPLDGRTLVDGHTGQPIEPIR